MKTDWDYTALAEAYLKRPDYASEAIAALVTRAGVPLGGRVCDVGAGVGHLTLMLAAHGLTVTAVEPNDAMRERGMAQTRDLPSVQWHEGTGEATGQPAGAFDLVTFGSSFNVVDRPRALAESHRLLKPGGWFACLWNHRELDDPIQAGIEAAIHGLVPGYGYGTRREDQTEAIDASDLFGPVQRIEGRVTHDQSCTECVEAWRSHATLQRQAGDRFTEVIAVIEDFLGRAAGPTIRVPYTTRIWMAERRP